jgi:excisionase family DNA binding protein
MCRGELATTKELASRARVSVRTIRRWVRRGRLPYIRLPGGHIRYNLDTILASIKWNVDLDGDK